ncbi:MAG: hypothetical protein HOO86_17035 [Bacteroidales bacterium]|nr:hypothetical protein [Bacteroidales bacterium]
MTKTYIVIIFLSLSIIRSVSAQDIPPPNPGMSLNIVSGYSIVFNFDEIAEYKDGIMNAGQSTFIRIGSVYDWKLQFNADQNIFYGENDGTHQMELNNVGLTIISTGTNLDDGSNITNYAITLPIALQSEEVTLLTKGIDSNRGWGLQNAFTLNWEMGTKRGNMNNQSMLEQMLKADTYNVNIILTLSVYP